MDQPLLFPPQSGSARLLALQDPGRKRQWQIAHEFGRAPEERSTPATGPTRDGPRAPTRRCRPCTPRHGGRVSPAASRRPLPSPATTFTRPACISVCPAPAAPRRASSGSALRRCRGGLGEEKRVSRCCRVGPGLEVNLARFPLACGFRALGYCSV
jgi:hypothetical protein